MSHSHDGPQHEAQRLPARRSKQSDGATLEAGDFVLLGVCFFLLVACIWVVFALIIPKITQGASPRLSFSLVLTVLLYLLCVGAGWLWGRYQSQTIVQRENLELKEQLRQMKQTIDRLESERYALQAQMRVAQPAAPARTSLSGTSQAYRAALPTTSKPPAPSLYESAREPEDTSDLQEHPHEKIFPARNEANSLRFGWHVIGASRRGFGHAYEGKYREDDFSVQFYGLPGQQPAMALIAIADGVSSKHLSRRGARAAVLGATGLPEKYIQNLRYLLGQGVEEDLLRKETFTILMNALAAARRRVEERAAQSRATVDDLQSTLLVFLTVPLDEHRLFVASTQIGDGALFVLQQQQQERWKFIQQPQIQSVGNEVYPFMRSTQDEWEKYFRAGTVAQARYLMGMTDGTADDIEPPPATHENPEPDPFALVHDFYQRIVLPTYSRQYPAEELLKLLAYRKKASHDDRTVVCVYQQ